jgi:hypothetical protein
MTEMCVDTPRRFCYSKRLSFRAEGSAGVSSGDLGISKSNPKVL